MAEVAAVSSSSTTTSTFASGTTSFPSPRWAIPDAPAAPAAEAANIVGATTSTDSRMKRDAFDAVDIDDDVVVMPLIMDPPSHEDDDEYRRAARRTADHLLPVVEQDAIASGIRAANVRGAISCEEEMASVARAQRHARYEGGDGNASLARANVLARARGAMYDEGLTMTDPPSYNYVAENTKEEEEEKGVRPQYGAVRGKDGMGKGRGGGYEVAEYEVSEYDTSEYDVSEYRSVYD
jgi:hypothetical protein